MANKSRFKRSRWKPGMVYAVPLLDGSYGFAQAVAAAMPNVIDLVVFCSRSKLLPDAPPLLTRSDLISFTATWRQDLNRGDWAALGITNLITDRKESPNQCLLDSSTIVGMKHSDSGLIEDLLNAWHGLTPWNIMHNENYFDEELAPGITKPNSAIILGEAERQAYRDRLLSNY